MKFIKKHYIQIVLVVLGMYVGAVAGYWMPKAEQPLVTGSTIKVVNANGGSEQAGKESVDLLGPKGVKVSPGPDFNKMIENSEIIVK